MREDIRFVESFFMMLLEKQISYCILRNADEVERGDAHDIDMTIDLKYLVEAESILYEVAKLHGWKLHLKMGSAKDDMNIKCYHFYKIIEQEIHIVHFDIFPVFSWNGYVLLDNACLIENIDRNTLYHKTNSAVEAVTKLFIRLLHNGYIKQKYKEYIHHIFNTESDAVKKVLNRFLDSYSSDLVYTMVLTEKWTELEERRAKLIRSIHEEAKKRSDYLINKLKQKYYLMNKAMKKSGVMVVFLGTDGSGKSTIINSLPDVLGNTFPESFIDYYHWRPKLIKSGRKSGDDESIVCTEPHSKKPYGKIKSFAKFMFFNVDYVLGYWLKVRWELSKGHMVVFDRYYYDYYLDKIRYRLSISDKILDFFKVLIPKPDITFLLVGDPEVLYERKKEISVEEIQEQINRLLHHQSSFNNGRIIDVNQPIKKVVNDVAEEILKTCDKNIIE